MGLRHCLDRRHKWARFASLLTAALALCACGSQQLLNSGPATPKLTFDVKHDGKYKFAYELHNCKGTRIAVFVHEDGGLTAPLPRVIPVVTVTQSEQTGSSEVSLYYGTWQVSDDGKPQGCSWTIKVTSASL